MIAVTLDVQIKNVFKNGFLLTGISGSFRMWTFPATSTSGKTVCYSKLSLLEGYSNLYMHKLRQIINAVIKGAFSTLPLGLFSTSAL